SNQQTVKMTVVLKTPADWQSWIFLRKETAKQYDLWQYCNPDVLAKDLPEFKGPDYPLPIEVNRKPKEDEELEVPTIANLTKDERECWRDLMDDYKFKEAKWSRKEQAMNSLVYEIGRTIDQRHIYLIANLDTAYERLKVLKQHLCPSDA
ncbi:hypothetical protein K505DRAFT_230285, partial [Melanomma pulvis-pyrius CBS 109.77]